MAEYNNTDVIDGEIAEDITDADVAQDGFTEDGAEDAPELPQLAFGGKAVLTADDERQIVAERIKEHEAAIARDELVLFEAEILGQPQDEVKARIATSYELVQRYIVAYNARYGGSENG